MSQEFVNSYIVSKFLKYMKKTAAIILCIALISGISIPPNKVLAYRTVVYVDNHITTDTVWNGDTTYVICYLPSLTTPHETPKVMPGVTLTIEAGAIILLGYNTPRIDVGSTTYYPVGNLFVEGNIVANGALFTGVTVDLVKYQWDSIVVRQGEIDVPASGTFTDCTFEGGGREEEGMIAGRGANLVEDDLQEVNIAIDSCIFQDAFMNNEQTYQGVGVSYSNGWWTDQRGEVHIRNSTFRRLGTAIVIDRNYGDNETENISTFIQNCTFTEISKKIDNIQCVVIRDGALASIQDCSFTNIGDVIGSDPYILFGYEYNPSIAVNYPREIILKNNTFDGGGTATNYPIVFYAASSVNIDNENPSNVFLNYPDEFKYAQVYGWIEKADAIWGNMGIDYLINDDVYVGGIFSSGWPDFTESRYGSLTILPGQNIAFNSGGNLTVRTSLNASGTSDQKIKFYTPLNEVLENPARIDITNTGNDLSFKYCEFDGMTQGIYCAFPDNKEDDENIMDSMVVEDCTFKNMKDCGMFFLSNDRMEYDSYTNNRTAFVTDCVFENNLNHGFSSSTPSYAERDGDCAIMFSGCTFRNNVNDGLYLHGTEDLMLKNCLVYGNGGNGASVVNNLVGEESMLNFSLPSTFINCTIANNGGYGIENKKTTPLADYDTPYGARVENSILCGNGEGDLTYNTGVAELETEPGLVMYSLIENSTENFGWGCITNTDPLFANEVANDYHLKSTEGRFNGTIWVNDEVTSPCINAGDPSSDCSTEPLPNGSVINMGAYGNTEEASKLTGNVPPGSITNLEVAKNNYNTLDVSWDTTENVDGYELYRSTKIAGEYTLVYSGTAVSYSDTGLTTGIKYYYTARTFTGNAPDRLYGSFVKPRIFRTYNFPKLATPTGVTAVATGPTSVRVSWDIVDGATGYTVWRKDSPGVFEHSIGDYTTLTVEDTGLTTGNTYEYSVRAFCGGVEFEEFISYISQPVSVTPEGPAINVGTPTVKAVSAGYNKIKLSWGKVTGATKYEIFRATTKTGKYSKIAETNLTSYINSKLTLGKTYYYKVRGKTTAGETTIFGNYSTIKYAKPVLPKPATVKAVRVAKRKIKISWSSVTGATGYEVYRATKKSGTYKRIASVKVRYYNNSKLISRKVYYYKIKTYRIVGKTRFRSAYSVVKYARA